MKASSPAGSSVTFPDADANVSEKGVERMTGDPEVVTHLPLTICADVIE